MREKGQIKIGEEQEYRTQISGGEITQITHTEE